MPRMHAPEPVRFWSRVDASGDCWMWTGGTTTDGYGRWSSMRGQPSVRAHRRAYVELVGPIPDGMTLDHLCRTRVCVNPDHLEPVTHVENVMRGMSGPARNARQTRCQFGHNDWVPNSGKRRCRTCRDAYKRRLRAPVVDPVSLPGSTAGSLTRP